MIFVKPGILSNAGMGAPRAREIEEVLAALECPRADDPGAARGALATLAAVDGSAHERSGACALLGGDWSASSGAPPPPEPLRAAVARASESGRAEAVEFDLRGDEELFGLGGLGARVEVWIEPVDECLREHARQARRAIRRGEASALELTWDGGRIERRILDERSPGVRELCEAGESELDEEMSGGALRRTLRVPCLPMGEALIVGSGEDARLLAHELERLGFLVTVAEPRPGRLDGAGWDRERLRLIVGGWEAARAALRPGARAFVVAAAHDRGLDAATLRGAFQGEARYVGLLGPSSRAARLLSELKAEGVQPAPGVFSAPAGLDMDAQTPREVALAVAAEILAVRFGRRGGRPARLRPSGGAPSSRRGGARVPGLILAAGRGRRFGAGSKMLAAVGGRAVLRHVVDAALASRLDPVIVVLGAAAESGLLALEGVDDERLRVVFNPRWAEGKASSFEVGLRAAPREAPGVVALLGDMPRVEPWLIERVLAEFELSGRLTFPVLPGPDGPVKGHPTAYPRELFGEVRELVGDDTAAAAVRRHWAQAVKIPLPDGVTQADVDTTRDLELLSVESPRRPSEA